MNTPFQHNDEFSAAQEQHLLLGALYGDLSEEEHAAWDHLKQQKPLIADEYTRLQQTTTFLSNTEQVGEHQSDTAFFDRQWQTLHAMMREEERKAAAPVPISLPSSVPPKAKPLLLLNLPIMQRRYGLAAMLVVAVGLGISVYRWQNTVSLEGSTMTERKEQEATGQDMKSSSATSPSESAREQAFGAKAKQAPSLSRPNSEENSVEGASEQALPKGSSDARPEGADADIAPQQPRDAVQNEVIKKDAEEASKKRPAERKQATPASETVQPSSTQTERARSEQEKLEQEKPKHVSDEARSTTPAPQASPMLDALKSFGVPQGTIQGGAGQGLENNLQAAPKRAAPASTNIRTTPLRAVTSTQPTVRVDSAKIRVKTQDSTQNK